MASDFELALQKLASEDNDLTREVLIGLSGPTRSESEAFAACFARIDDERKREAIARMVEYSEADFYLDYADLFRSCLDDTDPIVRRHAIEGLWEEEGVDLVSRLVKLLLCDTDVGVRAAAATALGKFMYLVELEELAPRYGATIRKNLENVIDNPEEPIEVVRRAIESIAFINDDRVRGIIDSAYAHEDSRMRVSALFAMGRSADQFWAETVLADLHDPSPEIRFEAARACGELQLRRAVRQLATLIQEHDHEVQGMAIWALGQIGGKQAREILESCAASDDEVMSSAAEDALHAIEFADGVLDLMAYGLDEIEMVDVELGPEDDDEHGHGYDGEGVDSEEWPDEVINLE